MSEFGDGQRDIDFKAPKESKETNQPSKLARGRSIVRRALTLTTAALGTVLAISTAGCGIGEKSQVITKEPPPPPGISQFFEIHAEPLLADIQRSKNNKEFKANYKLKTLQAYDDNGDSIVDNWAIVEMTQKGENASGPAIAVLRKVEGRQDNDGVILVDGPGTHFDIGVLTDAGAPKPLLKKIKSYS